MSSACRRAVAVSYTLPTRDEDSAKGRASFNIVWYRPAGGSPCLNLHGYQRPVARFSIPPPLIRRRVVPAAEGQRTRPAYSSMADSSSGLRSRSSSRSTIWPRRRLAIGRVVLLADAACCAPARRRRGYQSGIDAMCPADSIRSAGPDLTAAWRTTIAKMLGDW
jgi:hypothetical protein